METTNKHSQNGAPTSDGNPSATAKPSAGEGQENSENSGRRSDENRLHILKHGILSRNLLEALVERGESVREWRDLIRELRTDLQVEGPLAGVYFESALRLDDARSIDLQRRTRDFCCDGRESRLRSSLEAGQPGRYSDKWLKC